MPIEFTEDPIPQSVQEFLTVFKEDLSGVSFPDISIDILEKLKGDIHEKLSELQEATARVTSAQEALENSQNELIQKASRGLAYAKVYAEGREELMEKLSKLNLGKQQRAVKKNNSEPVETKRSRQKKTEDSLPEESTL